MFSTMSSFTSSVCVQVSVVFVVQLFFFSFFSVFYSFCLVSSHSRFDVLSILINAPTKTAITSSFLFITGWIFSFYFVIDQHWNNFFVLFFIQFDVNELVFVRINGKWYQGNFRRHIFCFPLWFWSKSELNWLTIIWFLRINWRKCLVNKIKTMEFVSNKVMHQ